MSLMAIDRRSLLLGTIAFVGSAPLGRAFAAGVSDVAFISAARRAGGDFCVLLLRADGTVVREVPLSGRGHDIAIHRPSGRVAVFARRPGTFAVAFDLRNATPPHIFTASEGRHYYGHGAFSRRRTAALRFRKRHRRRAWRYRHLRCGARLQEDRRTSELWRRAA